MKAKLGKGWKPNKKLRNLKEVLKYFNLPTLQKTPLKFSLESNISNYCETFPFIESNLISIYLLK